jgi:hypothetical protein
MRRDATANWRPVEISADPQGRFPDRGGIELLDHVFSFWSEAIDPGIVVYCEHPPAFDGQSTKMDPARNRVAALVQRPAGFRVESIEDCGPGVF